MGRLPLEARPNGCIGLSAGWTGCWFIVDCARSSDNSAEIVVALWRALIGGGILGFPVCAAGSDPGAGGRGIDLGLPAMGAMGAGPAAGCLNPVICSSAAGEMRGSDWPL